MNLCQLCLLFLATLTQSCGVLGQLVGAMKAIYDDDKGKPC